MRQNVTMEDIAKKLGVSKVAVSNALAGRKGVSPATRDKILETARQMGYRIRSRDQEENTGGVSVGVLVASHYIGVGSSFYWELYQNLAMVFARRGVLLNFEILEREDEDAPLPPSVTGQSRVDGLVILGMVQRPYLDRIVRAMEEKVVFLDSYDSDFPCSAVLSENYLGMYRSAKTLIGLGHREIGFVGTPSLSPNVRERYCGYLRALMEAGLPCRKEWCLRDRSTDDRQGMGVTLPDELPTAFACSSDLAAGYLYDALQERGLRVPEDISITGYDDYLYGHALTGRITTCHVELERMARIAADLLWEIMKGHARSRVIRVDGHMVYRESAARREECHR